jgi:hypothetical protein
MESAIKIKSTDSRLILGYTKNLSLFLNVSLYFKYCIWLSARRNFKFKPRHNNNLYFEYRKLFGPRLYSKFKVHLNPN